MSVDRFKDKLVVSLESDGKKWKLERPFTYYTLLFGEPYYITIPEGFETDFASIPKIFMPFLKWKDKFNKASVVHDWLYHTKLFDRKTADKIFLEAMEVLGIPKWKRYLFYWMVRLFGWWRWRHA